MWWYWRECDIGENVMILARMWWIRLVFWTKIATVGDILGVAQWNFEKLGIKNINKIKKYHFLKNRYFSLLFFDFPFWRNPNFGNFYWFSIDFLLENQVPITNKSGNLHRQIETGRIFERLNRKSVVSHQGNSYRSWFECVPHPSKALGEGARRVSATGVSESLRYRSISPPIVNICIEDIDQYHPRVFIEDSKMFVL